MLTSVLVPPAPADVSMLMVTGVLVSTTLQLGIPPSIQHYHSIYPLEPAAGAAEAPAFGVRSQVLKGISGRSGSAFALRRISPQQVGITMVFCMQRLNCKWNFAALPLLSSM